MPETSGESPIKEGMADIIDLIRTVCHEAGDTFAGFTVGELRDDAGNLLALQLVLCDRLGDIVAPRIEM